MQSSCSQIQIFKIHNQISYAIEGLQNSIKYMMDEWS